MLRYNVKAISLVTYLFLLSSVLYAQSGSAVDSSDISVYKKNIFLSCFFPKGIAEGVALRSYLRSGAWDEFRRSHSDRDAMDEIFMNADELCGDDRTAAILASGIATLEHKTIPLKLLFGIIFPIPLTAESQEDFDSRVSKLPEYIYDLKISDKDKLQHFFFSAYLIRTMKMNSLVQLLGNALETGEELFIVGGANDGRDQHANNDGIRFGEECSEDDISLPSESLTPNPQK